MAGRVYPEGVRTRDERLRFLRGKALEMAESGNFENAAAIQSRLIDLYSRLAAEAVGDFDGDGPQSFAGRLESICRSGQTGN